MHNLDLLAVMGRLRPRDYVIAHLLAEQRTLTTPQIAAILFTSTSRARARLYQLRALGWVDCFTPTPSAAGGRLPTHWVPGPLAATYTAHHDDRPPPTVRLLRQQRHATAASAHLRHTVGANQFFIDLLAHTRHHPGTRLARWWSAATAAAATARRVHPDGHGVWEHEDDREGVRQVGFWLEHDTGTETIGRLIGKIEPYQRLRRDGGPDYPLLLHLPSPARETHFHRCLADWVDGRAARLEITVATAVHGEHPAEAVWTVAGDGTDRHRLADLVSHPGRPGPYHPGPPTNEQDPLCLLAIVPTPSPS